MEISAVVSEKIASLLTTNGILSQDRLTKISVQCAQNKEKIVPELLKKNYIKEEDIVKVISRNFAIKTSDIKTENIKQFKLTEIEIQKVKSIIKSKIDSLNNSSDKIIIPEQEYFRQYIGFINSKGERLVLTFRTIFKNLGLFGFGHDKLS